jgi:hypothetical protein
LAREGHVSGRTLVLKVPIGVAPCRKVGVCMRTRRGGGPLSGEETPGRFEMGRVRKLGETPVITPLDHPLGYTPKGQ